MEESDVREKIEYTVVCISEFARKFQLSMQQAFFYLKKYKGIDYMNEFYDVEHLFSVEDTVDDLVAVCKRNGGMLA